MRCFILTFHPQPGCSSQNKYFLYKKFLLRIKTIYVESMIIWLKTIVEFTLYVSFWTMNCMVGFMMIAETINENPSRRDTFNITNSPFFIIQPFFLNSYQASSSTCYTISHYRSIYINLIPIYLIPIFKGSPCRSIRKKSQSNHRNNWYKAQWYEE